MKKGVRRVAVADLGSQAFRLEVADVSEDGQINSLYRERHPLMLAGRGPLSRVDLEEAVTVIANFGAIARRMNAPLRVAATAVFRAQTQETQQLFLELARRATGTAVHILTPREEATWSLRGTALGMGLSGRYLHLEVGGGSTQISLGEGTELVELEPVAMGATRLTRWLMDLGQRDPRAQLEEATTHVRELMAGAERMRGSAPLAVGTGGNARSLARVENLLRGVPEYLNILTLAGLEMILGLPEVWSDPSDLIPRFGLPRDRVEVLVAGAILYREVLTITGHDQLTVSEDGIRAGLIRGSDDHWAADHAGPAL